MNFTKETTLAEINGSLKNHLPHIGIEKVRDEIIKGLKSSPKYISPKYFYDKKGSELFETITQLDEYYPTRTEKSILSSIVDKLDLDFSNLSIIELGSGDASKISLLFRQISEDQLAEINYHPLDISKSAIEKASEQLAEEFPMISISGIVADFIHQINLVPKTGRRLFCFFGSTIGNLNRNEIKEFIKLVGEEMQQGDSLLLGMDMVKDITVLEKAYNDGKGITAQFNKNILNVINSICGTNFDIESFEHFAFYNKDEHRIEMHLKAMKDMVVLSASGTDKIHIKKGETIHTENSHKFNFDDIKTVGIWSGLDVEKIITDNNKWFSLVYYKKNYT